MTKREMLRKIEDAARMETHFDLKSMRESVDDWCFNNRATAGRYTNQRADLEQQAQEMGITEEEIDAARRKGSDDAWDAYLEAEGEIVHDDSYDDDYDFYEED